MRLLRTWIIPIKTTSEGNSREHWHVKAKRHTAQKFAIEHYCRSIGDELPCVLKLTRIAPKRLDDDNLQFALKHIRDYISNILIPGLRMGMADNDKRLKFSYDQERGKPKEYAVKIEVFKEGLSSL